MTEECSNCDILQAQRECDGCHECCAGWLTANVIGKEVYPGRPCHYLGEKGCTIYSIRPKDPCKNYNCHWLMDNEVPAWMKPSLSRVIMSLREWTGGQYLHVKECGEKMDSTVLNWIYQYAEQRNFSLQIEVGGSWYFRGPEGFSDEVA